MLTYRQLVNPNRERPAHMPMTLPYPGRLPSLKKTLPVIRLSSCFPPRHIGLISPGARGIYNALELPRPFD